MLFVVSPLLLFFLINYFFYGYIGSSFLCEGFLYLWQAGATFHHDAQASHYCGLSCCGAQAPDVQAQQLWLKGLVTPWHVGSSQTRARTHVPCIGRLILNHCTPREAPLAAFNMFSLYLIFDILINMCLGMFLLGFILYGTLCASWI